MTSSYALKLRSEASSETQGAVSRDDTTFVVRVYCKIETSPRALTEPATEPVPEAFGLPASDWPENSFSGQSAKRSSWVTFVFPYTT